MSDKTSREATSRPRYVIIDDIDAPEPRMVCQWVPGIGYCYLDRKRNKPAHDGMSGIRATPIEDFGWTWAEDEDGGSWVRFYRTERPVTATYPDGVLRRWQHPADYFEFKRLSLKVAA